MKIEIDSQIYDFLKSKVKGFNDTPNSVLRRLLLGDEYLKKQRGLKPLNIVEQSTQAFVTRILNEILGGGFEKVGRFHYLFKSDSKIIYFQNFNDESYTNWWYRIGTKAFEILDSSPKEGTIYLTNPGEFVYYALPFDEFKARTTGILNNKGIDVNIKHQTNMWGRIHWNLKEYRVDLEKK